MIVQPPRSTHTDPLFPNPRLCRSKLRKSLLVASFMQPRRHPAGDTAKRQPEGRPVLAAALGKVRTPATLAADLAGTVGQHFAGGRTTPRLNSSHYCASLMPPSA